MKKRSLFFIALILVFVCGGISYLWVKSTANNDLTLYGNVDIREVSLGLRVNGKLDKLYVEEGDEVKQGQKLASLDNQPYIDRLNAAKAQTQSAASTLDKLIAGPRQSEIDQSRADVELKQADFINAEQALERTKRLHQDGTVSQASMDQATAQYNMTKAALDAAKASLKNMLEGSRIEDIKTARANLASLQAQQNNLETELNDTVLVAPSDGIIRVRIREQGTVLSIGEPVYVLALTKPLRVRGYIGEPDLGKIFSGQRVQITNDSQPGKIYEGTIGFISSTAEFTPKTVETPQLRTNLVYRFWVTMDDNTQGLLQGMPVTIRPIATKAVAK